MDLKHLGDFVKECDKVKKENNEWREVCDDFDTPDEVKIMIDDLKECVKELQEENEKLVELEEKLKEVGKWFLMHRTPTPNF